MKTKSFSFLLFVVLAMASAIQVSAQGTHPLPGSPGDFHYGPADQCGNPRCNRKLAQENARRERERQGIYEEPRVPQEISARKPHPRFNSWNEALSYLNGKPIAVGEITPTEGSAGSSGQYAAAGYNNVGLQRAAHDMQSLGGAYGYGYSGGGGLTGYGYSGSPFLAGGYDFPVYSDMNPKASLGSIIRTRLEDEFRYKGVNMITPADGVAGISAEAEVGKNAGVWGNNTWETAEYVLEGTYFPVDEQVTTSGFDGARIGWALLGIGYDIENSDWRQGLTTAGHITSLYRNIKKRRNVKIRLSLQLKETASRQILFAAEGDGEVSSKEFYLREIAGYNSVGLRYPTAAVLADSMVEATLGREGPLPIKPVEQLRVEHGQVLSAVADQREINQLTQELNAAHRELAVLRNGQTPQQPVQNSVPQENDH